MQILLNTDKNVQADDGLLQHVEAEVESTLSRFSNRLTRVEIHLSDENAAKSGATDKRCLLEARPAGQPAVTVVHHAASVDEACTGALHKLVALLETKNGRSDNRKGGQSIRHLSVAEGLN